MVHTCISLGYFLFQCVNQYRINMFQSSMLVLSHDKLWTLIQQSCRGCYLTNKCANRSYCKDFLIRIHTSKQCCVVTCLVKGGL